MDGEIMEGKDLTLEEAAVSFLVSLPPEERGEVQPEVSRFISWYGKGRRVSQITPLDVANYAGWISTSTTDSARKLEPVRAFLTYLRKGGLTKIGLASHLKAKKKASRLTIVSKSALASAQLSPHGLAQLKAELESLEKKRARLIDEIQKAAADKDFSENAPLQAAREEYQHVKARIDGLNSILETASIITESKRADNPKVRLNSRVRVRDLGSGEISSYILVGQHEAKPALGKISLVSPLGKALLNQPVGNIVEVAAPIGKLRFQIEQIEES
jgi:transcription elongation GreA/GreB family factor